MEMTAAEVFAWEEWLETWGFYGFTLLLVVELGRLAFKRGLSWNLLGDAVTNFVTLGFFVVLTYGVFAAAYVAGFYWVAQFAAFEIPVTVAMPGSLCLTTSADRVHRAYEYHRNDDTYLIIEERTGVPLDRLAGETSIARVCEVAAELAYLALV